MKIWKWKTTIIDFNDYPQTYQNEGVVGFRGSGQRIIEAVFTKLGIPDAETHVWENGQYSCEYNEGLKDAETIDLIEVYTPSRVEDIDAEREDLVRYFVERQKEFNELDNQNAKIYGKLNNVEIIWTNKSTLHSVSKEYFEKIGEGSMTTEWCPFCECEVEIPRIGSSICPNCKEVILACSECLNCNCGTCPYEKL